MITDPAPAKLSRNEGLKEACPTLSGNIGATLANTTVDRFSDDDYEFLKFHGIYQGDDRDKRKVAKHYQFMVRGRLPGGVVSPDHYLMFDRLAMQYGNQTLRITSRQGFQFHGVVKSSLGPLMKGINEALATTVAACGDVNRNVMAPATPATSRLVEQVLEDARKVSNALLPHTKAYHQIWVEGKELTLEDESNKTFVDPLYGKTYLPRKFKTAFAIPPLNDVDIFTNCVGFIAIVENDKLVGYNLIAGGGLGMSHGNVQTYPRLADVIGFITPEKVVEAAKAVLTVHRDFGDRTNRKHARLKYVLEEKGVEWFRNEIEQRLGFKLETAKAYQFTKQGDLFGWHEQFDGNHFLGLYVESGRVKDTDKFQLMTALRKIVEQFRTEVRLTPSQNIILANVKPADREPITKILAQHGIPVENQASIIRQASMACPALPTCGLALAESERVLPDILGRIEGLLAEVGLQDEEIIIRMTGCPNGCARSMMSEIGLVGRAPNKYQLYLGGNRSSTRLNRLYKENVKTDDLTNELRPVLARFAQERNPGEHFGDFCDRLLLKDGAGPASA
ncbi:NADPH-dependent assimilatory sulfite reductase hemoprotein subunit [Pedosphaera parvula]|uniref:assimilatory sulfite reductase (NADPH) n=1 Tax=Pedosphaera parvula (strain Ellin514) TaxID=320771 RepID=B9XLS7_PEDPL|nr:NADPH-dependent assimilatory sulfite reductase hemoprotein subunit [Pedosphaera parvula]EEF59184.1 Sulfite reductase (NADPH) [Pedosphaera parvula Ellin514]